MLDNCIALVAVHIYRGSPPKTPREGAALGAVV
jgi:hypothetical protein